MDGGEEAGAQVVVQVLVLAHLKHFLPLLLRHLALDAFCSLLLLSDLLTAKLQQEKTHIFNRTPLMFGASSASLVWVRITRCLWKYICY